MKDQFNFLKYIKANPLFEAEAPVGGLESNPKYQDLLNAANKFNYQYERGTHASLTSGSAVRKDIENRITDLVNNDGVDPKELRTALERDVKGDARPEDVKKNIGYWFSPWSKGEGKEVMAKIEQAYEQGGEAALKPENLKLLGIEDIKIEPWRIRDKSNVNEPDSPKYAPIEWRGQFIGNLKK